MSRTGCRPSSRIPATSRPAGGPSPAARASAAGRAARVAAGPPAGSLEASANLSKALAEQIRAKAEGRQADPLSLFVPTVEDGARGVRFIHAAVESSNRGGVWVDATLDL